MDGSEYFDFDGHYVEYSEEMTIIPIYIASRALDLQAENEEIKQQFELESKVANELRNIANFRLKEIKRLRQEMMSVLDLLRTGTAPMAFNMTEDEWKTHKIYQCESKIKNAALDTVAVGKSGSPRSATARASSAGSVARVCSRC